MEYTREVAAHEVHVPIAEHAPAKARVGKLRANPSRRVDKDEAPYRVMNLLQRRKQPHPLRGVEPRTEEIEHVAFGRQLALALYHGDVVPSLGKLVCGRQPGDSSPYDQNAHGAR